MTAATSAARLREVRTRLLEIDDAARLTELVVANREFLAPFEPAREAPWFTVVGQSVVLRDALDRHRRGDLVPLVILDDEGEVVGRINLNSIVRGAFQSASLGYWLAQEVNGRGWTSEAVAEAVRLAFDDLGLHRVEASTLLHNVASQRVLMRNGFEQYGTAPRYLQIAGRWQDHLLFQRLDD